MSDFKEGDKVAYGNSYGSKGWTVSEVVRLTPTQAILADDSRVRQSDGAVMGRSLIAYPYEDVAKEVEAWRSQVAERKELRNQQGRVSDAYDKMIRGYFKGYTADQLKQVADAMEAAIAAKNNQQENIKS